MKSITLLYISCILLIAGCQKPTAWPDTVPEPKWADTSAMKKAIERKRTWQTRYVDMMITRDNGTTADTTYAEKEFALVMTNERTIQLPSGIEVSFTMRTGDVSEYWSGYHDIGQKSSLHYHHAKDSIWIDDPKQINGSPTHYYRKDWYYYTK